MDRQKLRRRVDLNCVNHNTCLPEPAETSSFTSSTGQPASIHAVIAEFLPRVEAVDSQHPRWSVVRDAIHAAGDADVLQLRDDGTLSSRQTVLAAFAAERVVGHLCFSVEPVRSREGSPRVQARLDSYAVNSTYGGSAIEPLLAQSAQQHARTMRCDSQSLLKFGTK